MNPGIFENAQRKLGHREEDMGLTMSEILTMPAPLRRLVNWMLRQRKASRAEIVAFVGENEATACAMLDTLIERGIVHQTKQEGCILYYVLMAQHRGRAIPLNIWQALKEKNQKEREPL